MLVVPMVVVWGPAGADGTRYALTATSLLQTLATQTPSVCSEDARRKGATEMSVPSDDARSSSAVVGGSWASAVSAVLPDVESRPAVDRMLVSALPLGAIPALELWAETDPSRLFVGIGPPRLGLTEWTMASSVVVSVTGEVDIATAAQLSEALGTALRRGAKGLVCDLTGVSFLGSTGLTALLVAQRRTIARHSWFDLVCPQPLPRKVIELLGLDAVLNRHDRVTEAVDAQAQRDGRPGL